MTTAAYSPDRAVIDCIERVADAFWVSNLLILILKFEMARNNFEIPRNIFEMARNNFENATEYFWGATE